MKTIKSRKEFEAELTGDKTIVIFGWSNCDNCKRQAQNVNDTVSGSGIPVYCINATETPEAATFVRMEPDEPTTAVFVGRIVKNSRIGLLTSRQINSLVGG